MTVVLVRIALVLFVLVALFVTVMLVRVTLMLVVLVLVGVVLVRVTLVLFVLVALFVTVMLVRIALMRVVSTHQGLLSRWLYCVDLTFLVQTGHDRHMRARGRLARARDEMASLSGAQNRLLLRLCSVRKESPLGE